VGDEKATAGRKSLELAVDLGFELGCAMAILGFMGDGPVVPRPGAELVSLFEHLGADAELIWIVASFGVTQDDEQTLAALRQWNHRNRPGDSLPKTGSPT
jgi:hypothetical protein